MLQDAGGTQYARWHLVPRTTAPTVARSPGPGRQDTTSSADEVGAYAISRASSKMICLNMLSEMQYYPLLFRCHCVTCTTRVTSCVAAADINE